MFVSMTGFGRAYMETSLGKLFLEIQSVNRRHLEISIVLPEGWGRFESIVRKLISSQVFRGQVNVRIHFFPSKEGLLGVLPSLDLLKSYLSAWKHLAMSCELSEKEITLPFLVGQLPTTTASLEGEKEILCEQMLQECLKEALRGFSQMRKQEGEALLQDLLDRRGLLEDLIVRLEKFVPQVVISLREKLTSRLLEVLEPSIELDERLLREVALFAERIDISEEVTRIRSHLAQLHGILQKDRGSVGKKIEFLIQELGREINTIGSKSADAAISQIVVDFKGELEKMREQIQNVE